ncbi:MAG: response regulator [Stellaceae bacterium]
MIGDASDFSKIAPKRGIAKFVTPLRRMNLTFRMFLLVFIAVLPALGIQAYNEYDLRKAREAEMRHEVVQITTQFGKEMGELREGASQLLLALGQLPVVKLQDASACSALFANLKQSYVSYNLIAATDVQGNIFCSSSPKSRASVADQAFFIRAMALKGDSDVAVGNYWVDPGTGQKSIQFAHRFYDDQGRSAGVVFAALDLDWLSEHLKDRKLTAGQSIVIADREGNIIARLPNPEQWFGKNMRPTHEAIMDGYTTGWEEAVGVDGITRIFGYLPAQLPPYDLFLSAGRSKAEAFTPIDNATQRGIGLILLGFLLAIAAAWYGGRIFIRRPIDALLDGANKWSKGNYDARVPVQDSGTEISRLSIAFNDMAQALAADAKAQMLAEEKLRQLNASLEDRVALRTNELAQANQQLKAEIKERERIQADLLHAQKIEAIGQLTSGIAHDFNNLLTAVLGNLEIARRRVRDKRVVEVLDTATRAGKRGAKLVGDLLTFSRRQRLQLDPLDVNSTIENAQELLKRSITSIIRTDMKLESGLWRAMGEASQLELAVLNLAINARDAMPSGGRLTISTANVPAGDPRLPLDLAGDCVMVSVADTGTGMSEEVRAKVFEPFFTTKGLGQGTGLGLSMVYGLVRRCGGSVSIDTRLNHGTTVSMFFPRATAESLLLGERRSAGADTTVAPQSLASTVLVVDDDPDVRAFVTSLLRDIGYAVVEAEDGQAALKVLEQAGDVDLLITDLAMPSMTGPELIMRARQASPGLPVILITGAANVTAGDLSLANAQFLKKPFDIQDLVTKINRALVGTGPALPPGSRFPHAMNE